MSQILFNFQTVIFLKKDLTIGFYYNCYCWEFPAVLAHLLHVTYPNGYF